MAQRGVRLFFVPVLLLCLAIVVSAQRPAGDARVVPAARADTGVQNCTHAAALGCRVRHVVKPFLAENCYRCHGNKKHEEGSELRVVHVRPVADRATASAGTRSSGSSGQRDAARRGAAAGRAAAAGGRDLAGARARRASTAITPPDPGRVTARRLNRTEYNNTDPRSARRRHRVPPTTSRRTMPATASTTSPTCCRCRRC